jgi:putative tryptophan/tyrosine transport system permease protein
MITLNEIMMSLEIGLIYGIVALGIYLTFRIIDFPDLTCDGSFVLGAAVSSILIKSGYNPWFSLVMALFAGGMAGFLTGILYARFKVTHLLSGILTSFMLYSINLHVMGGIPNITLMNSNVIFSVMPIITLGIVSVIVCIFVTYLLMTDFGLALRSIGQNKRLAQNNGINVLLMTVIGLMLSNAIIALGGALFSQQQGFADVGSGIGTVIVGLASVMIGERVVPSKSIFVQALSCLIGSVIYRMLIGFALHSDVLGISTQDLNLLTGIMVVIIMYMPKRRVC